MKNLRDHGFTLIELMVCILIFCILMAIAVPTFLGAKERAQQREREKNGELINPTPTVPTTIAPVPEGYDPDRYERRLDPRGYDCLWDTVEQQYTACVK